MKNTLSEAENINMKLHMKVRGNLETNINRAITKATKYLYKGDKQTYSQLNANVHDLKREIAFPFISYLVQLKKTRTSTIL
jgi:hypothetical protein